MSGNEPLTVAERAACEWQLGVSDFGEEGQRKLKGASVLVSRLGGLGGVVAYELAAAGARVAGSNKEVGAHGDIIEICVLDDAQLNQVVAGDDGVLAGARPGTIAGENTSWDWITGVAAVRSFEYIALCPAATRGFVCLEVAP